MSKVIPNLKYTFKSNNQHNKSLGLNKNMAPAKGVKEITRIQNIQIIIEIGQIEIEKTNNIIQINYEVKQRWIVLWILIQFGYEMIAQMGF